MNEIRKNSDSWNSGLNIFAIRAGRTQYMIVNDPL